MKKLKYPLKLLLNIFNNSIPNNMSKWDYKKPVSMNKGITLFLKKEKNLLRNATVMPQIIAQICWLIRQMNVPGLSKKSNKKKFIRLNPSTAPKTCCSMLKQILNK